MFVLFFSIFIYSTCFLNEHTKHIAYFFSQFKLFFLFLDFHFLLIFICVFFVNVNSILFFIFSVKFKMMFFAFVFVVGCFTVAYYIIMIKISKKKSYLMSSNDAVWECVTSFGLSLGKSRSLEMIYHWIYSSSSSFSSNSSC